MARTAHSGGRTRPSRTPLGGGEPAAREPLRRGSRAGAGDSRGATSVKDEHSPHLLPSADVDPRASIGADTTVWHLAQVREGAVVGEQCIIGRGAYIDAGVEVGARSKIQNFALVYAPARLGVGVFIGPAAVLTNDTYPRSIDEDGQLKR